MKKQRITLEIVWDDTEDQVPAPETWDWRDLLDLGGDENVTVVHGGPVTRVAEVPTQ